MSVDLSAYDSIQTNLFVKLDIPDYDVLTFSDYHKDYTILGTVYQGLGELLAVTATVNNLRAAPDEITVSIAGIPSANITDIIGNKVKGSSLRVYRGFFDPVTGELLSIAGNPAGKFQGIVSNYNISDELDMGSSTGSIVLTLTVTSVVSQLENKLSGRRTNPADFATESSMNRVSALAKSNFNFGAPT
jgi:hypothetical protein